MPAQVDRCVSDLTSKWKSDPASRPKARKEGQTAEQQAWAICQAAYNKSVKNALELMLSGDGFGPTLIGAAATNRPYIPNLKPTKVVDKDGATQFLVHLANSGHFNHPVAGPFVLNRAVFSTMKANLDAKVIGQDSAYDSRHKPELGALGWFEDLMLGDEIGEGKNEFWGLVNPTPAGLETVGKGTFKYSSMEFHRNYKRDDVVLDLENVTEDFCLVLEKEEPEVNDMPGDTVNLEEFRELQDKLAKLESAQATAESEAKQAEERAKQAEERALQLEMQAMNTSIQAVIELSQTKVDQNGNGLPRQLIEWISKFLKLEEFGKDKDVVKLSDEGKPGMEVVQYMVGAVRQLVLEMPGSVPAQRKTHSDKGDPEEDNFDYGAEWEA